MTLCWARRRGLRSVDPCPPPVTASSTSASVCFPPVGLTNQPFVLVIFVSIKSFFIMFWKLIHPIETFSFWLQKLRLSVLQITLLNQYLQAAPPPQKKKMKPFSFYLSWTKISFQYRVGIYTELLQQWNKKNKKTRIEWGTSCNQPYLSHQWRALQNMA